LRRRSSSVKFAVPCIRSGNNQTDYVNKHNIYIYININGKYLYYIYVIYISSHSSVRPPRKRLWRRVICWMYTYYLTQDVTYWSIVFNTKKIIVVYLTINTSLNSSENIYSLFTYTIFINKHPKNKIVFNWHLFKVIIL